MDDATKIVNEMVGEPGDVAKFVRAALPDVYLAHLVTTENDESTGGWIVRVKGVPGDDSYLGLINWHNTVEDERLYFVDPEQFIDAFMVSPDWAWKSGAKWVKRSERNQPVYHGSMTKAKAELLREPMVQRRIARLTGKNPSEVESIVDKSIARESIQERITGQLTQDGWTILKAGFHATGRAYIVGRAPGDTARQAVESVDIAAICAHAVVENIQAGKRAESAPWQVDFTILADCEDTQPEATEPVEELEESEVKDFVQSYMNKWRVGRHEWGSGASTYYVFKGIGDKQPDAHNRYGMDVSKGLVYRWADYFNWLEGAFTPSDRFDTVEKWWFAANLAGMQKRWNRLLATGKVKYTDVKEGYEDVLQATVRAAIPSIDDRAKVSDLSKRLEALGVVGDIRLNYHEIRDDRHHHEVSIHIFISHYPNEWNTMLQPNQGIIRPIMQHVIEQSFSLHDVVPRIANAAGGGFIAYWIILRSGKVPVAPRTQFIYAAIGQDAEYRVRSNALSMEAMSPGDLARATDMDAHVHAIMVRLAARMQELGAKGVVYAKKPGPHPLEPGKEMLEIGYHLTKPPTEEWYHGGNFRDWWSDMVAEEFRKHPGLPQEKMMAYGKVTLSYTGGGPSLKAWIPYDMPGRFLSHKNVNIVLEGMDPSDLYARSIRDTPLQLTIKIEELRQALKMKGYHGEIGVKPSAAHKGLNLVVVWLYKPDTTINPNEMKADIQSIWGDDSDRVLDMGFRRPAPSLPRHHQAFSFITRVGGPGVPDFKRKIEEAWGPGELYRRSIRLEPMALKFKVDTFKQKLKEMGYHGRLWVQKSISLLRTNSVIVKVFKPGIKLEPEDVRKDAKHAWGEDSTMLVGTAEVIPLGHPNFPVDHVALVINTDIGGYEAAQTGMQYNIEEAIDPSDIYQQSLKGTFTATQLAVAGVSNDLAKRGYHGRFSIRLQFIDPLTKGYRFHAYLQGIEPKGEMGTIYQDIITALDTHGFKVDGNLSPRLEQSEDDPRRLDAHIHARIRTTHVIPEPEGIIADIQVMTEGMDPGELYRRSLENTDVGAKLEGERIAQALTHRGYKGQMVLNTAAVSNQRKGTPLTTPVTIYLDAPNNEPSDAALAKMETDLGEILWNMGIEQDTTYTQRRAGIKFEWYHNTHRGGVWEGYINLFLILYGAVTHGDMTWTIGEAMDPSALYAKSIERTSTETRLKLAKVTGLLAQHGYTGSVRIAPGEAGWHPVLIYLANVPRENFIEQPAQNVRDAFRLGGMQIDNYIDGKWTSYPHDHNWGIFSAYGRSWSVPGIPAGGLTVDIQPVAKA